jgi:cobalt-zinc-cadmium efflux system membrane fusion protein
VNARLGAVIACVLLAACTKPPAPRAAAPPPKQDRRQPQTVDLDEKAQQEAGLTVVPVEERGVEQVIRANGRLTTNENTTWRVGAITDGRIIAVFAKTGDRVEKGQVLARLHSHDIHEARAEYRKAVGEVARWKGSVEFTRRTRDRMRRLYEMKAASFEQLDMAENELKTAQAALANAETEQERTRLHLVEFLQIPLIGPEEKGHPPDPEGHLDDLIPIRAPETGIVLTRLITPGSVVTASGDLFVICDLTTVWALAAVQEEFLAKLRPGMPARVSVQAYPGRTFPGRVSKIEEKLDPETRTVQVRVDIKNDAGLLKPEMYSTVELDAGASEKALLVPQEAIQDVNQQSVVFVLAAPGRFAVRPVETGRTLGALVQVSRGLAKGDRVVARGSFILKSQLLRSSLSEE